MQLTRKPDMIIFRGQKPYINRWFLFPRNRWFNIYLHHGLLSDYLTPHDHPWWNVSVILKQGYKEYQYVTHENRIYCLFVDIRKSFDIVYRSATQLHRLELVEDKPFWSLVITGPKVRDWGFQTRNGWKSHQEVLNIDRVLGTSKIKPEFEKDWV